MAPQSGTQETLKRVLVADDDPDVLMVIGTVLRHHGYSVETAHDGKECLQKVAAQLPDVIILDIMMPVMSGDQVAKIIKNHPKTLNIPIIFLTALADRKQMKTALFEMGVEFYLTKPVDSDEIIDKVQQAIRYKVDPHIRG